MAELTQTENELLTALQKAVSVIEQWHNFPATVSMMQKEKIDYLWKIYRDNAPEMRPIVAALKKYGNG